MGESHNEDVLWVMHMIMHRYRAKQFEMLRDGNHDVTHMEAKVLSYVGRNPGAAPGDLSRFMERDKAQLARLIKGLRDKGLLTSDSDPLDRRIMRLTLTESGLEIRKTMQQQGQRLNKLGIRGFSEEEHQQLLSLVGRVYDNFEQE
ncbi:MarR family winged helix-turn-helix transcriptional regulator [Rouxiella badensis]|jgi:DNA-binding MarR family transcriptional regulator|uniref:MarR family transcriptional regulator n=1 Tax=Rouxiella badensis TaxID=1646377 RepID=A0A1X0WIR0_9GAMM|nr:MarR family transcriptional regulator [Rouxiella badensis]MCC3701748.1 winged helix DNA-binding protein [Rouxiella badensis]MCC3720064.1 winged helix DNA-binding protein [Rouxiella badensis]MCC3729727.1 winged helix DNA-binding protein [Rouxiella badensis]MCC3731390.1 winged helix DNA-binding protein [Rouxiella badensis]MCC3738325.1 winged helix DNA-binding protein [Rouxiella badensis]